MYANEPKMKVDMYIQTIKNIIKLITNVKFCKINFYNVYSTSLSKFAEQVIISFFVLTKILTRAKKKENLLCEKLKCLESKS